MKLVALVPVILSLQFKSLLSYKQCVRQDSTKASVTCKKPLSPLLTRTGRLPHLTGSGSSVGWLPATRCCFPQSGL